MSQHYIPVYTLIPFILILLSIALFPLFSHRFWNNNKNKLIVAVILSLPIAAWLFISGLEVKLFESVFFDYVPFIILLGSLFVITGGIFLDGDLEAKPVSYTHLRAHETDSYLVCRLLLEKKK